MFRNLIFTTGLFAASLFVCSTCAPRASALQVSEKRQSYQRLGQFAPTFYRILNESASEWKDEPRTAALLSANGELIGQVTPAFKLQLDIEGSARLRDGRIVNFHKKVGGSWRYMVARNAPFGLGVDGYKLIPFRTLAVDPNVIKPGTVLYIPALDGLRLPSGEIHDGYFFAHDEGQGITGNRIDVFVGYELDVDNTLTRSGRIENMKPVQVYQVDDQTARRLNRKYQKQFAR